jgi:jumonji domain-containing protein 7
MGQKHFVLLPPIASFGINEQELPAATYQAADPSSGDYRLEAKLDEPSRTVPTAVWDPDIPNENATKFSALLQPVRVTLDPGDMLYLPALWYHKVSQSCGPERICCAVNYW